jgi:hypothetical protein
MRPVFSAEKSHAIIPSDPDALRTSLALSLRLAFSGVDVCRCRICSSVETIGHHRPGLYFYLRTQHRIANHYSGSAVLGRLRVRDQHRASDHPGFHCHWVHRGGIRSCTCMQIHLPKRCSASRTTLRAAPLAYLARRNPLRRNTEPACFASRHTKYRVPVLDLWVSSGSSFLWSDRCTRCAGVRPRSFAAAYTSTVPSEAAARFPQPIDLQAIPNRPFVEWITSAILRLGAIAWISSPKR